MNPGARVDVLAFFHSLRMLVRGCRILQHRVHLCVRSDSRLNVTHLISLCAPIREFQPYWDTVTNQRHFGDV